MTTNLASPLSTNEVTWLSPNFRTTGFLVSASFPSALFWAAFLSLATLSLTITYGTPLFLQSDGNHKTNSIGSTSWAMTTNLASPLSTNEVTWLSPNFRTTGFLVSASFPSALFWAAFLSLATLSFLASGVYLAKSLHKFLDWLFCKVLVNWLTAGGTLN